MTERGPGALGARLAIAKQFLAAAGLVLSGRNPARRMRNAVRRLALGQDQTGVASRAADMRVQRLEHLPADRPVCLFMAYAADGRLFPHTLRYCADLRAQGLFVLLVVATDRPDLRALDPGPDVVDGLLVRGNSGYDFAAWADALRRLPALWDAPELWFANDSMYHSPRLLPEMVARVRASAADLVALTASEEVAPHVQSYFFALKAPPDRRQTARRFWDEVRPLDDKLAVIRQYEIPHRARMEAGGLTVEALYATPPGPGNHLQGSWRSLLEQGFPFVKVELLRDNPFQLDLSGWRAALATHGFVVEDIAFHLGARSDGAAALMELG